MALSSTMTFGRACSAATESLTIRARRCESSRGEDVTEAWNELWNELHHQGHIGEASFAALPHLVRIHEMRRIADWNTYAIAGVIELARDTPRNPPLPLAFRGAYEAAWERLVELGSREL